MRVLEEYGDPLCTYQWAPGNTASGIPAELLVYTERDLPFTSGGTTEIEAGDWIVGATSAAKAQVISVVLTSGTWANGDALGTFRIKNQIGTFVSENLKVAAGSNDAAIAANSTLAVDNYLYRGMSVRYIIIEVLTNNILFNYDGGTPDQTSLIGLVAIAPMSLEFSNIRAAKKFLAIDYAAGSASKLTAVIYF